MPKPPTAPPGRAGGFRLEVPLDASRVEGFKPDQPVKVLVVDRKGAAQSQTVELDEKGAGLAAFEFAERPEAMRVMLGPSTASDEELQGMQTINVEVPLRQWRTTELVRLAPVSISSYYWHWWPRWCRKFVIRGRVLCHDGRPVPGAKVCAYDVDWWWWWSAQQQVGCDTTDATGSFEISFTWCCGFWPWWWWRRRFWRLEPVLAERIVPVLQRLPKLKRPPAPDPRPDLGIFEELLAEEHFNPRASVLTVNPDKLGGLRDRLLPKLPAAPELERLRIWPWWPWFPWWDCTPDIIFRVTQDCREHGTVVYEENIFQTRPNIPTSLDVTLVANEKACCIPIEPPPEGNCMVITQACDDPVSTIGGNPGASPAAATLGYKTPGVVATAADRPYGGVVPISGLFGDNANVDYYEFEWSTDAVSWNDMPPVAAGGFTRYYWGPQLGGGPVDFHPVTFAFASISGRNVVESREHFEANNDPASWGLTRFWTYNRDLLMVWLTENNFADDLYYLRVKAWDLVDGTLKNDRILPLCDTRDQNRLVLRIDNRVVGPGSGHPPSVPDHPCGGGTVHTCTMEPDTDFLQVRINGAPVGACVNVNATQGGSLEIDFFAYDPNGHLAYYTLIATYRENLAVNLLGLAGATLAPLGGAPVPAALQVGSTYAAARLQGAAAPVWAGGALRLTIPNLRLAFPETCCYQLELRAYKRTIVSCDDSFLPHSNKSEFTFGVIV